MRTLFLGLAILALPLTGCDSGSDDNDDDDNNNAISCADVGLSSGTLSGTATSGSVSADCFELRVAAGRVVVTAFDIPSVTALPRAVLTLTFAGVNPGSFSVGGTNDQSSASYSPSGSSIFDATSGSISLTENSESQVSGTFNFATSNSIQVSNGRFTVQI